MIYTLSAVGFLKMLLYIIGFYFLIKILARLFAPFLVKYAAKKMEKRFGDQFGNFQNNQKQPKDREGETVIDRMPRNNKSSGKKVGEYIDYEEVD